MKRATFSIIAASVFFVAGCTSTTSQTHVDAGFSAVADVATDTILQRPSEGLTLKMYLDLSEYTDMKSHDRFSHGCVLALGSERYVAVGTLLGTVVLRYDRYLSGGRLVTRVDPDDIWFFEGPKSQWRECRGAVFNENGYIYVVSEGAHAQGMGGSITLSADHPGGVQIIRLERGVAPVMLPPYVDLFNSGHTIFVRGMRAYVNGAGWRTSKDHRAIPHSRIHLGGMRILDLSDPENPVDLGGFGDMRMYPVRYTHDSFALGEVVVDGKEYNIVYAADIYSGWIRVLEVSDPQNVVVLDSVQTPLAQKGAQISAHNVWTTEDGKWLFATEETAGSGLVVYDNADPRHPEFVTMYRPDAVADSSIAHNVVVRGRLAFVSWYTDGVRVIDISDPRNPKEVAYFDTSDMEPESRPGRLSGCTPCQGNWSVDVDEDGYIHLVDMQNGYYKLELDDHLKPLLRP